MNCITNELNIGPVSPFCIIHIPDTHLTFADGRDGYYRFDETGSLVMVNTSSKSYIEAARKLKGKDNEIDTKAKAENIARERVRATFGDVIDEYTTVYERFDEIGKEYFFTFAPTYGEDGYIVGEECHVSILTDGTPVSCSITDIGTFADFDENSVMDIKKIDVYSNAERTIKALYGDELVSCEIKLRRSAL